MDGVIGSKRLTQYQIIFIMFVMSGFAGLMYQVLFTKALALVFGSTSTATYTVLATYMGGMAIGAWLGGLFAFRLKNPIRTYGFCELGIAAFCALTPLLFVVIRAIYIDWAGDLAPDHTALLLYRVLLGGVCLLVPTILMGMTLPILARHFELSDVSLGRSVGYLYAANTVGAATGALLTGYLILPGLGVSSTTLLAVALNALIALFAFKLAKDSKVQDVIGKAQSTSELGLTTTKSIAMLAFVILTVGGFVTLGLEVLYVHLLAVVAGNSTYAFALMLFAFLIGLSAGSEVARRLLVGVKSLLQPLLWLEVGLCVVVLVGLFIWQAIPDYFAGFAQYPLARSFAEREVVRGLVCLLVMIPPAFFIGALYPVCMEAIGGYFVRRRTTALGWGASLNTVGNILGVLIVGFVCLPSLGALNTLYLLAAIVTLLSLIVGAMALTTDKFRVGLAFSVLLVAFLFAPKSFDYTKLSTGANVYFHAQPYGTVVDHAESVDGGLTTVAVRDDGQGNEITTLLTNGKFQGDNGRGHEMRAQAGFALVPLMYTVQRNSALVIGYGTGVSSRVIYDAGFDHLTLLDLSKDIVRLADRYFADVNKGVSSAEKVDTYITDGRNYLMLDDKQYDLISMEISSIWFAGAASLYNQEFYELVKARLADKGVFQQWVQLHRISKQDIFYILNTLHTVFPNVWLYEVGGQGILIASEDYLAPSVAALELVQSSDSLAEIVDLYQNGVSEVLDGCLMGPSEIDRMVSQLGADRLVSTDNNMYLEHSTPKGNVREYGASIRENLEFLASISHGSCSAENGSVAANE
jgi:spermidine synthase/MFS family permease